MKALKKFFNFQTLEQKKIISQQYEEIIKMAENESKQYNSDDYKKVEKENSTCPICQNKKIVNKIAQVIGGGSVSGNLFGIYGSSSLNTSEVNHCSTCGNQWKKSKRNFKDSDDFVVQYLNNLATHFEGKYTFAEEDYLKLKNYYAETFHELMKKYNNKCYSSTKELLTLTFLRSKFFSIF